MCINTKKKQKLYTLLDGSLKLKYNDIYYSLKQVDKMQNKENKKTIKTQQEINRSKAHKPSPNHPYVVAGRRKFRDNKI